MRYTTLFFDLDDTLYDNQNGLWRAIRERMSLYLQQRMGFSKEQIPVLREQYYRTYGTTLRGLQAHYEVDAEEYLAFVHNVPLELYLQPAPDLRALLESLPQKKWVFTNADQAHARRVLSRLGLKELFEGIIDVQAVGFACKPDRIAYERALEQAGSPDPESCVMFDDSLRNLEPASQMGFTTVLIGQDGLLDPGSHHFAPSLLALKTVLPELWMGRGEK